MFQTIKRMHPLSDYIIPKEKNILSHKTSSMDRAPVATRYNQQIAFQPNELAPLQGQLLPSLMEKQIQGLRWKACWQALLPIEQPVHWTSWVIWKKELISVTSSQASQWIGGQIALALGVLTESSKNGLNGFLFQELDHWTCLCLFLASKGDANLQLAPLKEGGGEKSKCTSTTPGRVCWMQASTSRTSSPKRTEGFPMRETFHWRPHVSHTLEIWESRFYLVKLLGITSNYSVLEGGRPFCPGPPSAEMCMGPGRTSGLQSSSYPCPQDNENQVLLVGDGGRRGTFPRRFCLVRGLLCKWPWNLVGRVETDLMRQKMRKRGNTQDCQIKARNGCPPNRRLDGGKGVSSLHQSCSEVAYPFLVSLLNPKGAYPSQQQPALPSPIPLRQSLLFSS